MFKVALVLLVAASAVPSEALFKTALLKKGAAKVALAQQIPKVLPGINILPSLGSLTTFGAATAPEVAVETEADVEETLEGSGEDTSVRPVIQSDEVSHYFVPVRPYAVYAVPYPYASVASSPEVSYSYASYPYASSPYVYSSYAPSSYASSTYASSPYTSYVQQPSQVYGPPSGEW